MGTVWRGAELGIPRWAQRLTTQFGRPAGPLGQLVGWLMAKTNKANAWIVELADIQPGDRVLEVGFGPGIAIGLAAERVGPGRVAGIDTAEVMLKQASRRNKQAIEAGTVHLQLGDVHQLPYPDASFTKAYSLHSLYFWHSLEAALGELRRVLEPGGRLVLGGRKHRPGASAFDPARYGLKEADAACIIRTLEHVGFEEPRQHERELGRETVIAFVTERPSLS